MSNPRCLSSRFVRLVLIFPTIWLTGCSQPESADPEQLKKASNLKTAAVPEMQTVSITSDYLRRTIHIPADLSAFRNVSIYPKVQGFIKNIYVDRGSVVRGGQILVNIIAPELDANYKESQAKYEATKSALLQAQSKLDGSVALKDEAEARLGADEANYRRIKHAAETEGAIAPMDLEAAEINVRAAKARVRSAEQAILTAKSELQTEKARSQAAEQALSSVKQIRSYLTVRAPFDGVISERNVHEGSLVSSSTSNPPMLKIEQTSKLRLLVPVPESAIAGIRQGTAMSFTVPAFVGKDFSGVVSRISHTLDRKSRTMIIELDVNNKNKELQPGMYAEVTWKMERPYKTLFIPSCAVLSANDKLSVMRVRNNKIEVVTVSRGQPMGSFVEVVGNLKAGDELILHPSEDLSPGSAVQSRPVTSEDLEAILSEKQED